MAAPVLASCGADGASTGTGTAIGSMAYQLGWIKNFQYGGEYIADDSGFYAAEKLTVDLVAGGPTAATDAAVQSGKVLLAQSGPDLTANAVAQGADLKIIGANYQRSPYAIISLGAPISSPADLAGKRIGVQSVNEVAWAAFLQLARIDPSSFTKVPVQFDMTPLTSGEVDGFWGFTNDNVVTLKLRGLNPTVMPLADYGYKIMTATYTARTQSLQRPDERDAIIRFLRASIKGWQAAVADPARVAELTVDKYGQGNGLDRAVQEASSAATNELMVTAETQANGLMTMSDQLITDTLATLSASGIHADRALFDQSVLADVFAGKPTL
ncbi:ABC transporter substrate-binding protein [Pseudonocardia kujensis]|uniref:ABC transporter substrate-binding protein n=1 Tax=Pseudonocardia kujensis TaxID=1128675 RepID=UPI001E642EF2|nr:ABC transporter substrate-binding protein [Pseudonocardia kujensis]MCE0764932.1 ABC transporter substrate-binding protein [Pseudonocardia kujensis]